MSWVNSCKEITSGVEAFKVPALPKVLNGRIYKHGHGKLWNSPNSSDTSSKLGKLTWLWTTNHECVIRAHICIPAFPVGKARSIRGYFGDLEKVTSVSNSIIMIRDFDTFPGNDHIPHFKGTWVPTILRTSPDPQVGYVC